MSVKLKFFMFYFLRQIIIVFALIYIPPSDPCSTNPCENSGTCSRDLSNVDDVTNFLCQCTDEFEGDVCQFAKVFHFG